jgi:hypothetical protein
LLCGVVANYQFSLFDLIFQICVLRCDCASKMAAGTVPATFSSLRTCDSGLGFGKSVDFVRVSDLKTMKSVRRKVSIIRNSNPSQDIAELQPASKGSQLLGMNVT